MANYKPGMILDSIKAFSTVIEDDDDGRITGLQVNLTSSGWMSAEKVTLSTIGNKMDNWSDSVMKFHGK